MRTAKLFVVDEELDPDLGVTEFISRWSRRYGLDPTFLFTNVRGSRFPLVMNLLKRQAILHELGVAGMQDSASILAGRLAKPGKIISRPNVAAVELSGLGELPLLKHQPGDVGRYLTSFVGALVSPVTGGTNLGFYRGLVASDRDVVLFMDSRTDASRIVQQSLEQADEVPITLFCGGPVAAYLAAAAKLPFDVDSYEAAARWAGKPLAIANGAYPAAPSDAEIVLQGFVTRELRDEGPFGEFKGYYCTPTKSPLVRVEHILAREDAICLGLFCGKESGLTLMSLQNEILLVDYLRRAGFEVQNVRYPLAGFGEYLAIIEAEVPSRDLIVAALDFDPRAKCVIATRPDVDPLREAAIHTLEAECRPYMRYGKQEGSRLGLLLNRTRDYRWAEL